MRIVSGGKWTTDGRWVVIGPWYGAMRIVHDPAIMDPWFRLQECLDYVREES